MRNDINLLQKRKSQKYSAQKWAMILLCIALFAGAVYAGFTIPANARIAAQLNITDLRAELLAISGTNEDLSGLNSEYAQRKEQLDALTAIDGARADMSGYVEAIEASLPSTANIAMLTAEKETISVLGIADNNDAIAAFCLRLRETGKFSEVFLSFSTLMENGTTSFSIELALPVTLDGSAMLPDPSAETSEGAEASPEVTQ
jgi:Tfp pilus assembly protein PilN